MTIVEVVDGARVEYLLRPGGSRLAVVFHGGHMRAELEIGHETFIEAGWSVLQASRPGYGQTPLSAGPDNIKRRTRQRDLRRSDRFIVRTSRLSGRRRRRSFGRRPDSDDVCGAASTIGSRPDPREFHKLPSLARPFHPNCRQGDLSPSWRTGDMGDDATSLRSVAGIRSQADAVFTIDYPRC